jgi:NAD+ kinase
MIPKRVAIVGKNAPAIRPMVEEAGFVVVEQEPEMVVSYGGDGTLMVAEHLYPGVPKVILKDSLICKMCSVLPNDEVLRRVAQGQCTTTELIKLEARVGQERLCALNDITVHNDNPRHALRYTVAINGKSVGTTIVGDGVVVATPFGSTAYYRSITDSFFELGIGIAFNNSTEQSDHMVLRDTSEIRIAIARGPASVYADNQEREIVVGEGSEIVITKSSEVGSLVITG